jgi:hypothetical protein
VAAGKTGSIDPFVNAFMVSDDSNNPLAQSGSGIQIRQDSRFSLAYQYSDNLTISLPVHILNFEYGGEYAVREVRHSIPASTSTSPRPARSPTSTSSSARSTTCRRR